MTSDTRNSLQALEETGDWNHALQFLVKLLKTATLVDAQDWHRLGRLHQRLGAPQKAHRSYQCALCLDSNRPQTFNNLALLELNCMRPDLANYWLERGLNSTHLSVDDEELLQATACDLRLFQLRPDLALIHVQRQLNRRVSVMALVNQSVCFHKLGRLSDAVCTQERAIKLHLKEKAPHLLGLAYSKLVGQPCFDLESSIHLQSQLMNLGIYRLCLNPRDSFGLDCLMAGRTNDQSYWLDTRRKLTHWDGDPTENLIIWDDQGYGDTLQNLSWLIKASEYVESLQVWLRPSLISLVTDRFELPINCSIVSMDQQSIPWEKTDHKQVGFFFLPMVLNQWSPLFGQFRQPYLRAKLFSRSNPINRIGLVWSAGHHQAPQPERSARVRDVPLESFLRLALAWSLRSNAQLVSMQLKGHEAPELQPLLADGRLEVPLNSTDWTATASELEQLDILVTVDTSVAHLAGALGIPTLILLSSPADWRWGEEGTDTFLYSSVTLARCKEPGDWSSALVQADNWVNSYILGLAN